MTAADDSIDTGAGGSVLLRHITAQAARRAAERAAAGRPDPVVPPVPVPRGPDRVIASAIGRAADRVHGMPLFFDRVSVGHAVLAEVPELLPEQALILAVEGPGGAMGTAAICPGLLSSLIEMQATGRVSSRQVRPRKPTRKDGSITGDFVSALLKELAGEHTGQEELPSLAGFSYASFLDDPRPLMLMLEDGPLSRISIRVRLGSGGKRVGQILIAIPETRKRPAGAVAADAIALPHFAEGQQSSVPTRGHSLAEAVQNAPVALVGVLCRKKLNLATLKSLIPGAVIALPSNTLDCATLETSLGQVLARGRFGEADGFHAVRLHGAETKEAAPVRDIAAPQRVDKLPIETMDEFRRASAIEPSTATPAAFSQRA